MNSGNARVPAMVSVFRQRGFTLLEISIVLVVVATLLGYTVAMMPRQQDLKQYRAVDREMDAIIEHLIAFAQVNGRLPCPDTAAGALDGLEDRFGLNSCSAFYGFLPARSLGIDGDYGQNNLLLDPWGAGYRYAVSDVQLPVTVGPSVLVTQNGVRDAGMAAVTPNLYLCDDNTNAPANDTNCVSASGNEVLGSNGEVAAVIISLGARNAIPPTSTVQNENIDNFNDGTLDRVYILASRNEFEGTATLPSTYYDDVVKWVPTNLLFSRMIDAAQLP